MTHPADMSVVDAMRAVSSGEFSVLDLTNACLSRIESKRGKALNSFITLAGEAARAQAVESDERTKSGLRASPIDGLPIAVKDNIDIAGMPTSNGLATNWMPEEDAPLIKGLRAAGVVFLGKLNMHEGALGATTDNRHHGRCEHPTHKGYTPGGSSGGSATAVAANLCPATIGSDTMGSVRLPSAYCGIVGFKPSRGYWSTEGIAPLCYRLDTAGPLARSVADVAALLSENVTAGSHEGMRFGQIANFETVEVEPECTAAFEAGLQALRAAGVNIDRVRVPGFKPSPARVAGFIASEVDAAVFHEGLMEREPEAFSPEFRRMLDYGHAVTPGRYVTELRHVEQVGRAFVHTLRKVDVVISLTAPQRAFKFGEKAPVNQADLTAIANFSGCPAISLPLPVAKGKRPVGLQLISPPDTDRQLLSVAAGVEQALSNIERN